jgi:drug/metabolite transporter (DMT)-like permease
MVSKYFDLMVSVGKSENAGKDYGVLPYVFALFSSIIWPLSWIYCNEHSINTARTTMIRGCTCFIANYLICLFTKTNTTFPDGSIFKRIILRSLILSLTSLTMGVSQYILPLSIVHMIMSSSTLFVFVIDYLLNGVKVNLKQAIGISIGMVGVVLASNGKLISTMIDP